MKWIIAGLAMMIIGLLEWYALSIGINGTAFTMSMAFIAGLGGFMFKAEKQKREEKKKEK